MLRASVCGRREANGRKLNLTSYFRRNESTNQTSEPCCSKRSKWDWDYVLRESIIRSVKSNAEMTGLPKEWHMASKATSSNPGQALGKPNRKKQVQMLPIYEAMHKVHTHLLTEESLGCQPLLLLCRKGKSGRLRKRVFFSAYDEALSSYYGS